jgi:hypothetical protein
MGANPQGDGRGQTDLYWYVHNVFANFYKDFMDYLSKHLYPRFEYTVIGTYDKGIEYIMKECQYGREVSKPMLPSLILNPSGDFDLADANAGGHQLWRFPNLAPGMVKYLFDPIYKDENLNITVGFIRIKGDIELLMLLNSFYEYCDLRMLFLQIFGGYDRWIYPQFFNTFIILPEEVVNYEYNNPYTGQSYTIDWERNGAYQHLVKTIGKEELVVPCNIKPIYKLAGFSDPSNRYGGADAMADWRLGATVNYELEVPAWIITQSDYLSEDIHIYINTGSVYSAYDYSEFKDHIPYLRQRFKYNIFDATGSVILQGCNQETEPTLEFNARYFYTVTQGDVDSTADLIIQIPETILNKDLIILNSKYGQMEYGDHYVLQSGGNEILVKRDNVDLEVGMIIEIYTYKLTGT